MAFTFLKAKGTNIGKSVLDEENIEFAKKMINEYGNKIILPGDINAFKEFNNDSPNRIINLNEVEDDDMGLDIGPETIKTFSYIISTSKTVFWNGPLGVYEFSKCTKGTEEVLKALIESKAIAILGGGDIVAAASNLGFKDKVTHASTGGGATLEYMEGKDLPGISCIPEA